MCILQVNYIILVSFMHVVGQSVACISHVYLHLLDQVHACVIHAFASDYYSRMMMVIFSSMLYACYRHDMHVVRMYMK